MTRRPSPRSHRPARRGFATLVVMWVLGLAIVMLAGLQAVSFRDAAAGRESLARVRAEWAARAGVEATVARLEYQTLNPDLGDAFAIVDELAAVSSGRLDGAAFRATWSGPEGDVLGPSDEHAKINIHTMTAEGLMLLPLMTEDVADSILDWADSDDDLRTLGAEIGQYQSAPYPYEPRNGPFRSMLELELVLGVEPDAVRGEDWNLNGLLDPSENDGDASWPPDNADGVLDAGWSGILTAASVDGGLGASGEALLDLRVASANDVVGRLGVASDQADAILIYAQQSPQPRLSDYIRWDLTTLVTIANGASVVGGRIIAGPGQVAAPVQALSREQLAVLLDECTLDDPLAGPVPGRLNINTCSAETLEYLPGLDPMLADAIIVERESRTDGFVSITDLLDVPGLSRGALATISGLLVVRSNVYTVRVDGWDEATGRRVEVIATLDRSTMPVTIKEYRSP